MVDKTLSEGKAKAILGVSGSNTHNGQIRADEFLPELRGKKAIRTYQQMRDNDATIGAVLYAVEQILRDVDLKVVPVDNTDQAKAEANLRTPILPSGNLVFFLGLRVLVDSLRL